MGKYQFEHGFVPKATLDFIDLMEQQAKKFRLLDEPFNTEDYEDYDFGFYIKWANVYNTLDIDSDGVPETIQDMIDLLHKFVKAAI